MASGETSRGFLNIWIPSRHIQIFELFLAPLAKISYEYETEIRKRIRQLGEHVTTYFPRGWKINPSIFLSDNVISTLNTLNHRQLFEAVQWYAIPQFCNLEFALQLAICFRSTDYRGLVAILPFCQVKSFSSSQLWMILVAEFWLLLFPVEREGEVFPPNRPTTGGPPEQYARNVSFVTDLW